VKIGSLQFTYANTQRAVNVVGLTPSTTYSISIYAVDNEGIHTAATTISVTTGSATPRTNPGTLGPASLSCSQIGTTAGVLATWNIAGRQQPDRYNIQINCRGIRNKKIFVKGSLSTVTVSGVFGRGIASASRACFCRLRPFYDKSANNNKKYPIPLLTTKFTIAT
jgi:hypothetical protein